MKGSARRPTRIMGTFFSRVRQKQPGEAERSPASMQFPDSAEPPSPWSRISKSFRESTTHSSITDRGSAVTSAMELFDEHIIHGAEYDSVNRSAPPRCYIGTRTQLRGTIDRWFFAKNRQKALLWLNGPAGVGKTAIIQSLAESLATSKNLAASLFFSRSNNCRDPSRAFATIGFQLSSRISSYQAFIVEQITLDPTVLQKEIEEQFRVFITEPFGNKKIEEQEGPWVILLDGLDECEGLDQQRKIVQLISCFTLRFPRAPLVWVIASRREAQLSEVFMDDIVAPSYWPEYVPIDSSEACEDVGRYLRASFNIMRERFPNIPPDWPSETQFLKLANGASGLLLFAKSAITFIGDVKRASPVSRLNLVLYIIDGRPATTSFGQPFAPLDAMYTQILRSIPRPLWTTTKQILGFSLCARGGHDFHLSSRSLFAASRILNLDPSNIYDSLHNLHSVLKIPPSKHVHQRGVSFLHESFADYLVDSRRSQEFCISVRESLDDIINSLRVIYLGKPWDSKSNRCSYQLSAKEEEDFYRDLKRDAMAAMNYVEAEASITQENYQTMSQHDWFNELEKCQSEAPTINVVSALEIEPDVVEVGVNDGDQEDSLEGGTGGKAWNNIMTDGSTVIPEPYHDAEVIGEDELLNATLAPGEDFQDLKHDVAVAMSYLAIEDGITHANDQSLSQRVQSNYLDEHQPETQVLDNALASVLAPASEEDVAHLLRTRILSSKDRYKTLLEAKGSEAQRILDLLQNLLNSPHVVCDRTRGSILTALLRLAVSSGLYPQQLKLNNIEKESSPVTAGQFGEIWRGEYQGRPVCLKIFKLYQRSEIEHLLKHFSREAIVWSQLSHPNLLPFYGIYHLNDTHGRVGLVSPWMENGNLTEYLGVHPDSKRLPFVHDILAGLRYLHRNQVVHGDLKGVNILINADGSACLADFGLSSVMDADVLRWTSLVTITQVGGTVRWMPPEMIEAAEDGLLRPSFASDIYSLASVMFEIFTGQIPYHEFPKNITVLSKVLSGIKPGRPELEKAPELGSHIWEVMEDCWSTTPNDRPTLDQVIDRISVDELHPSQAQPASVELRSLTTGTLMKSDVMFLMTLLDLD